MSYSHDLTRELIELIKQKLPDAKIFFNDPLLINLGLTKSLANHDDYLHVRFPGLISTVDATEAVAQR
jgi:hypothetical protein